MVEPRDEFHQQQLVSIVPQNLAGSTGVAPVYVDLESTRSHYDPPPALQSSETWRL